MTAVFMTLLPGILGIALGASAGLLSVRNARGLTIMFSGIGGVLGYIAVAGLIWMLDQGGMRVFTTLHLYLLVLSTLAALGLLLWLIRSRGSQFEGRSQFSKGATDPMNLLFIPFAMLVGFSVYQQLLLPAFGWDSLDFCVVMAKHYLYSDATLQGATEPFAYSHYQPITAILIAAYSGYTGSLSDNNQAILLPWLVEWLTIMMVVYGLINHVSERPKLALLFAYICGAIPLLENHMLVAGYAEMWLTGVITASAALIVAGLRRDSIVMIITGSLVSLLTLTLKNTGAAYCAALLAPLLLILIFKTVGKWGWALLAVIILPVTWLLSKGFDITIAGNRLALSLESSVRLDFAGRVWLFTKHPVADVAWNEFYAFAINSSFSIWLPAFILAMVLWLQTIYPRARITGKDVSAEVFVFMSTLAILFALAASQLLTDYGFDHATPHYDTGNSRFTLPAIILGIMFIGLVTSEYVKAKPINTDGSNGLDLQ